MSNKQAIVLVGGPDDGHIVTVCGMPPRLRMPSLPSLELMTSTEYAEYAVLGPQVSVHTEYEMALDANGYPSRRDDGILIYRPVRQTA